MVIHTVLMRFDDPADADEAVRLLGLAEQIDVVRRVSVGRNLSSVASSFDVGLVVEVDSLDDLAVYLAHPAHEAAAQFTRPRRTAIASCDITA